jgi:regulatory protein
MSTITSIEPQVKDKNRCSVFIDGRFYCGIKLEVAIKYHLKSGMSIDKSELDKIQLDTEKSEALDKAMTHLSATPKTQKQMCDFLSKKGYTQAVCDYVIERLRYYGFLDDCAYCRAYVNSVHGKGKRALEADLIKRGADKQAIASVLDELEEDDKEALEVLTKYMRGKEPTKENYYKGFKYLLSKGYSYETAKNAIEGAGDIDEDN